ncbi:NADPH:quinone reductase [Methylobacterium sp. Leaf111]|uniref:zinc-dependent alcohol dehydrogenase family protein n=1 Tax=unclassified Methylobacterium TaxID=2615210 RepID=UPI0006F80601|nr:MULTISPECIES: zinc-dependent alcohol dehydrogenase family protein [unclassified Methylobacterium]KQO56557.1 NADPH:quinone reductase [Methylobacterium sp. Leaf86]KQP69945.1 NADPH:quinone reductase [Methylobacterium sp. Leaf111]
MTRVVRIHEYGDASVLRIDDVDVPAPAANEVQIKVKAIGINRAEVMFRSHAYLQDARFPSRLGYEASGVVEAVGSSVRGFVVGDAVSVIPSLDISDGGTYGELVNVQARLVVKHPQNLSYEDAAAVWMPYVTAWGALIEQAKLSRGEAVIISAASSSVGIAAFQIAKRVGATVIATTRTDAKRQALLDAGADHVVATEEEDLVAKVMEITDGNGARVVFDPVGGPSFGPLTASMARGGILLEYGVLSAEPTPFPLFTVLSKSLTLKGYLYIEVVSDDAILERAKTFIMDGLVSGALKPLIARVFAFADIQDAHRFLESNEQIGKVVVTL